MIHMMILTNFDEVPWNHMVSLGHSVLTAIKQLNYTNMR